MDPQHIERTRKPTFATVAEANAASGELRRIKPAIPQRYTVADRWDYTVAELRQVARDNGLAFRSRDTHDALVALLAQADIELPAKPPERIRRAQPMTTGKRLA